jgi:hypothetical protein
MPGCWHRIGPCLLIAAALCGFAPAARAADPGAPGGAPVATPWSGDRAFEPPAPDLGADAHARIEPIPGGRLVAGELVEISWRDLPQEVEELEILLSVDGGLHYALRVSPELDGRETRYRWRVPQLTTADARLRIRMRIAGVETDGPIGPRFEIAALAGRPVELAQVHEGSWWTGIEPLGAGPRPWFGDGTRLPQLGAAASARDFDAPGRCAATRSQCSSFQRPGVEHAPTSRPTQDIDSTPRSVPRRE